MTCREKLKELYPDWDELQIDKAMEEDCPDLYMDIEKPEYCYARIGRRYCTGCWQREVPEKITPKTITYVKVPLTKADIFEGPKESIYGLIIESIHHATREGIEANSILINKNMVRVPEEIGRWPTMICGLNAYFTEKELPDRYSFAVFHNPNHPDERLAKFEAIGMEPDELRKAAEMYRAVKEVMGE